MPGISYGDLYAQQFPLHQKLYGVQPPPAVGSFGLPPEVAAQAMATQDASGLQGLPPTLNEHLAISDTQDAVQREAPVDPGLAMAFAMPKATPGGIVLGSRTVTRGVPISEETMNTLHAGQGLEQQGLDHIARTAKTRAVEEGDVEHERGAQADQAYVADAARYNAQREAVASAKAQSDQAFEDIRNGAEDPQRYFAKMDPFAKAMSLLGVALSGMGGGPNKALEILNRAQEQDIAAQRQALSSKRGYAESKRNALGDLMKIHGDQNVAVADLRARQSAALAAQTAEIAARYKGTEKEGEAMHAVGLAMQSAAEKQAIFEEKKADHISEQFVNRPATPAGGAMTMEERNRLRTAMMMRDPQRQQAMMIPDPEERKKALAELDARGAAVAGDATVKSSFETAAKAATITDWLPPGRWGTMREDTKVFESAQDQIAAEAKRRGMTEKDAERFAAAHAPSFGDSKATLDRKRSAMEAAFPTVATPTLAAFGLTPPKPPPDTKKELGFKGAGR